MPDIPGIRFVSVSPKSGKVCVMRSNDEKWVRASLIIFSEQTSVKKICEMLNVKPTRTANKSERYSKRNPLSGIREDNFWLLESDLCECCDINTHLEYLLSVIRNNNDSILKLMETCDISIFIGFASTNGQGGFSLMPKILEELSFYNIILDFDLYPPSASQP